jgi:antitoxin (DNA-binding transcriptional repressor) of toxin-antitoxin stability system
MKATVMDLRYRTKDVLRALEAREEIVLTHRGVEKGMIVPLAQERSASPSISTFAAVGMWSDDSEPVQEMVARLRKPRLC